MTLRRLARRPPGGACDPAGPLDRLKKKGHKLKADEVRFFLAAISETWSREARSNWRDRRPVRVDRELCPVITRGVNLDEVNREKLQKVINKDPLALIEYWSVDPN